MGISIVYFPIRGSHPGQNDGRGHNAPKDFLAYIFLFPQQ